MDFSTSGLCATNLKKAIFLLGPTDKKFRYDLIRRSSLHFNCVCMEHRLLHYIKFYYNAMHCKIYAIQI